MNGQQIKTNGMEETVDLLDMFYHGLKLAIY